MTAKDRATIVEYLWDYCRYLEHRYYGARADDCARLARLVESWPVLPAVSCDGGTGPGVVVWVAGGNIEGVWDA